jgi:thiamine biosynthesis lipoprotein
MIHRLPFRAMNTDMLACVDVDSDLPPHELNEIPRWFADWEQTLSRFRPDSELSRLNEADSQPVPVSPTLWEVFQAAREADRFAGGLVTPTVLDAMIEIGYDRTFDALWDKSIDLSHNVRTTVSPLALVKFDEGARTITRPRGIHLDFGGIAKGWAAQEAMLRLSEFGPALMNAGGDVATSGPLRDGSLWEIGVFKPFDRSGDYLETIHLAGGAVATSSTDRRHWKQGGQTRHHIIDPRTGLPAVSDVVSATAVARTVLEAESAAKSVLIRGSEDGLDWLEADPTLAALIVLDSGELLYSQRIIEYL